MKHRQTPPFAVCQFNAAFAATRPDRFAMHAFHKLGESIHIKWYALMDFLDARR